MVYDVGVVEDGVRVVNGVIEVVDDGVRIVGSCR